MVMISIDVAKLFSGFFVCGSTQFFISPNDDTLPQCNINALQSSDTQW